MAFRRVAEAPDGPTDEGGDDAPEAPPAPAVEEVPRLGPPLFLLGLGALSVLLAFALVPIDSTATHVLGYLCATLIPIVAIGLFRRFDLLRRKSPNYRAGALRPWMVPAVAIAGLVAAFFHVWALATQLAS